MSEWNFNKKDLEKYIKQGEEILKQNLTKLKREEVIYEIELLEDFIQEHYDYEESESENISFYRAKTNYLNNMKKIYKELGKETIKWLIALDKEKIFPLINSPHLKLDIEEQKEYTLKNYEKNSKNSLFVAKQILSPYPTNQIQVCKNLEDSSFSRYISIADLPLIVINPNEGAAILNHELEHAIESTIGYRTNYFYSELGSIFYEILFNNLIYINKSILPKERLEDFMVDIEVLSEYFELMLEFAKYDFKVSAVDFKNICIKTLDLIPNEIDDWLEEEFDFDYEGEVKYIFSHLKAIELVRFVNHNKDTLDLIEPYINTKKFYFEADTKKFKIYESYIEEVKQKTLKR